MGTDPSGATRPQDDTLSAVVRPQDVSLLQDIAAQPRPTGSDAIAAARARCVRELRELGYEIVERPFEFSGYPGRFATPLLGSVAVVAAGSAMALALSGQRFAPALILGTALIVIALAAQWMARTGVRALPAFRERGVNLEARRPGDAPALWLCAHLDSKSQPIPSLVRVAGTIVMGIGLLATLGLALTIAAGVQTHEFYWEFAGTVTLIGWVPVGLSMVGTRSPGALDNASGVASVVGAARRLQGQRGVGVLITDAEELGLAGARAWAQTARGVTVLNCDGVDDRGAFTVMSHGPCPAELRPAVEGASHESLTTVEFTRMLPGILTDSVAYSDAGHTSVTFSRGTLGSLARVHSARDNLANLSGDGIATMASLLAATAKRLTPYA